MEQGAARQGREQPASRAHELPAVLRQYRVLVQLGCLAVLEPELSLRESPVLELHERQLVGEAAAMEPTSDLRWQQAEASTVIAGVEAAAEPLGPQRLLVWSTGRQLHAV